MKFNQIVLIEDEQPAANKMKRMLQKTVPGCTVQHFSDIESALENSAAITNAELIFSDIQLTDGLCFEIFEQLETAAPIIFTTAYSNFMAEAFNTNGVAYLLKPVSANKLEKAINKAANLKGLPENTDLLNELKKNILGNSKSYKNRFTVKVGDHLKPISVHDIVLFKAEGRTVYAYLQSGKQYIVDYTLEDVMQMTNPNLFFRVNRSFVMQLPYITDVLMFSSSRLRIETQPTFADEIIVSRERVANFKAWFEGDL